MLKEENYESAFQMIAVAGDSKSNSMLAIDAASEGDFEKADDFLEKAEKSLKEAHGLQLQMIREEAGGNHVEVNIVLIHAQDHLTMAMLTKERAEEAIRLYKIIQSLKS